MEPYNNGSMARKFPDVMGASLNPGFRKGIPTAKLPRGFSLYCLHSCGITSTLQAQKSF
jgi:hypothetical protein